jgi:steroid delta-isomerase-like uncharacterized protein
MRGIIESQAGAPAASGDGADPDKRAEDVWKGLGTAPPGASSSTAANKEQNLTLVRRYIDSVNRMALDDLDEIVAADYVDHNALPDMKSGLEGLKQAYQIFATAFPDVFFDLEDLIGEGDLVVARGTVRGTHQGDFFGIPATGKKATWTGIHIFRIANGKAAEGWLILDQLRLMQQLGVIPSPDGGERPPAPVAPTGSGGPATTPEQNKETMRRFIEEVWNKGNFEVGEQIFHPGATSPSAPQLPTGPEGVKVIAERFRSAFPDFHMSIDMLIADGDEVAALFTETGTHLGELMGTPPTGKKVNFREIGILRFEGGQVVESWYEVDMLGMMRQLGLGG